MVSRRLTNIAGFRGSQEQLQQLIQREFDYLYKNLSTTGSTTTPSTGDTYITTPIPAAILAQITAAYAHSLIGSGNPHHVRLDEVHNPLGPVIFTIPTEILWDMSAGSTFTIYHSSGTAELILRGSESRVSWLEGLTTIFKVETLAGETYLTSIIGDVHFSTAYGELVRLTGSGQVGINASPATDTLLTVGLTNSFSGLGNTWLSQFNYVRNTEALNHFDANTQFAMSHTYTGGTHYSMGGSGTYNLWASLSVNIGGAHTDTGFYSNILSQVSTTGVGVKNDIRAIHVSMSLAGSVTTAYGLYVEGVTGATNNYAIYTKAGEVHIIGDLALEGTTGGIVKLRGYKNVTSKLLIGLTEAQAALDELAFASIEFLGLYRSRNTANGIGIGFWPSADSPNEWGVGLGINAYYNTSGGYQIPADGANISKGMILLQHLYHGTASYRGAIRLFSIPNSGTVTRTITHGALTTASNNYEVFKIGGESDAVGKNSVYLYGQFASNAASTPLNLVNRGTVTTTQYVGMYFRPWGESDFGAYIFSKNAVSGSTTYGVLYMGVKGADPLLQMWGDTRRIDHYGPIRVELTYGTYETPVVTTGLISAFGNGSAYIIARDKANHVEALIGGDAGGVIVGSMTAHLLQIRTSNTARVYVDASNAHVSVGSAATTYPLRVSKTHVNPVSDFTVYVDSVFSPSSAPPGFTRYVQLEIEGGISGANLNSNIYLQSVRVAPYVTVSLSAPYSLVGVISQPYVGSGGITLTTLTAFESGLGHYGTGSITQVFHLSIAPIAISGGGTVGTQYGVWIGALTNAAQNYAIYSTSEAQSYHLGNIGVGTNYSAAYKLYVYSNSTAYATTGAMNIVRDASMASGSEYGLVVSAFHHSSRASGDFRAAYVSHVVSVGDAVTFTGQTNAHYIYQAVNTNSTGTISGTLRGMIVEDYLFGNGNIGSLRQIQVYAGKAGTGTLTSYYGVYISNPGLTGGTITSAHGLYIEAITAGSSNYAIYSAGGNVYFVGDTGIGIAPNGDDKLYVYYADTHTAGWHAAVNSYAAASPGSASTAWYIGTKGFATPTVNANYYTGAGILGLMGYAATSIDFTVSAAYGLYARVYAYNSLGAVITAAYGVSSYVHSDGTGSIVNAYGIFIQPMAGTITNVYGVYVAGQTVGSSINYAIFTAGSTPSYLGGVVGRGNTPNANYGITNVHTFNTTTASTLTGMYSALVRNAGTIGATETNYNIGVWALTNLTTSALYGFGSSNYGLYADGSISGAGTVTRYNSIRAGVSLYDSAVLGTWYGIVIDNPGTAGTSSVTNVYGLYIAALTKGTSNNYAIYSAGGQVYLAGSTAIATSVDPNYALSVGATGALTGSIYIAPLTSVAMYIAGSQAIRTSGTLYIDTEHATGEIRFRAGALLTQVASFDYQGYANFASHVGIGGVATASEYLYVYGDTKIIKSGATTLTVGGVGAADSSSIRITGNDTLFGYYGTITALSATLTAARTWSFPDATGTVILSSTLSSYSILETQITDGSILARVASTETISGAWTFTHANGITIGVSTTVDGKIVLKDLDIYAYTITTATTSLSGNVTLRMPKVSGTFITTGNLTDITSLGTISGTGINVTGGVAYLGSSSALAGAFGAGQLEVFKTTNGTVLLSRDSVDTGGPTLEFLKRRSGWGVISSGDRLGSIGWSGADSIDAQIGAQIWAEVNGTPASNVMPTDIVFATGTTTPAEVLRIDKNGDLFSTTFTDYSGSSTIVGWSSRTTTAIYYKRVGKLVFVEFYITGTSNSATTTFTLPFTSLNKGSGTGTLNTGRSINNGATAVPGAIVMGNNSNICTIYSDMQGSGWTASGTKTIWGSFFYQAA